jgi:hypothetical protein
MKFIKFDKESGKQVTAFGSDFLLSELSTTNNPANVNSKYLEEMGLLAVIKPQFPYFYW